MVKRLKFKMPIILIILLLSSCGNFAVRIVADALTSGQGTTFTGDDDPELIRDALPFALKTYETLLNSVPDHQNLHLTTGSAYIMYANAFIHTPATMLSPLEYETKNNMLARAKKLYLRGRAILIKGIDLKYSGFKKSIEENNITNLKNILNKMNISDVPFLYWTAAGWMLAFSIDSFDMNISITIPLAKEIILKALELNPTFNNGAIYDFLISFYGSLPEALGGSREKAKEYFKKSIELTKGESPSPYVSYAKSIAIPEQNLTDFTNYLTKAISIDPDKNISNRLANIITIRQAKWLLDNYKEFFIVEE